MKTIIILLLSLSWASVFADESTESEWKSTLPMEKYEQEYDHLYMSAFSDPDTDGGYCVFLHDNQNAQDSDNFDLITAEGAVSKWQINQAVRYASYPEQAYVGVPPWIIGSFVGMPIAGVNPVVIGAVAVGAQLGFMGYFLHKGVVEEESSKATVLSVASVFPQSITVEMMIRQSRTEHLIEDDKLLTFSSEERGWRWVKYLGFKKLDLIASRLQEMTPKYPQGCQGKVELFFDNVN